MLGYRCVYFIDYPDVAKILAHWIENGLWDNIDGLAQDVWNRMNTVFPGLAKS